MKTRTLLLLFVLMLATAVSAVGAALQEADALVETKVLENIAAAMALYEAHLAENPNDGEALWLMAKAHLYYGDRIDQGILAVFEKGRDYAEQAVARLPESPDAHYWLAALMGRVGQTRGVLNSLFMVGPMKDSLERVLELDPDYAPAYYVLSLLYDTAPGWPLSIGHSGRALENAETAVALDAEDPEFQLHLAKLYAANRRRADAVAVLEHLLTLEALADEPEIEAEARSLLASLSS